MRKSLLFFGLLAFVISSFAQVVPAHRLEDWSYAGYRGEIPSPTIIVDVTTFGAVGDGVTDDYAAINSAINSLGGQAGVVYFPAGTYLLNSRLNLPDSVVLRGVSSATSLLKFDLGGSTQHSIQVSAGQPFGYTSPLAGYTRGSYWLKVGDPSLLPTQGWAELRQNNGAWDTDPATWASHSVGQILHITDKRNDTIFFENPLRITYDSLSFPRIRKIEPIQQVGIECLGIERLDNPASGGPYNIYFNFAANCWVRGVESSKAVGSHIFMNVSSNISVTGCYIHHAFDYTGSATRGYGVTIAHHGGENLIENNIFRSLRHAMMVKQGANGNVFAYNYSIEPTRPEFPSDAGGDISLHGHYPFANLFEGNIVQNIHIDTYWGPSGPYNSFIRNRAEKYGIYMSNNTVDSDSQHFVGNEVTGSGFLQGMYALEGTNHIEHGNNQNGSIIPSGTTSLNDDTYYLPCAPAFWNIAGTWPSIGIGNSLNSGTIPAKVRYLTGNYTECSSPTLPIPIALPDSFSSCVVDSIPFDLLPNDLVFPGNSIQITQAPTNGIILSFDSIMGTGIFLPDSGFNGVTSMLYSICGDCGCADALVFFEVGCDTIVPCGKDAFEPNDSLMQAVNLPRVGARGVLCESWDEDWFSFEVDSARPHIRLVLTRLSEDYDLALWSGDSLLASSHQLGGMDEVLEVNSLSPNTPYYAKVYAAGSEVSEARQYYLWLQTRNMPFAGASKQVSISRPASHQLSIRFTEASRGTSYLSLRDLSGRIVWQDAMKGNEVLLDVSNYAKGIYLLEGRKAGMRWVEKVMIR